MGEEKTIVIGNYIAKKKGCRVVPDDPKLRLSVIIRSQDAAGAKAGQKVRAEITKWPAKGRKAEGKILEILGKTGEPETELLSLIRRHSLPETFPAKVLKEAKGLPEKLSSVDLENRRDRRHLPVVTIDGEDAKDLDDGVYAALEEGGNFFLGVYIADVSLYVKENHPLDLEARERGTSVYLPRKVIPMLPPRLSNDLCSLNAGEDRPVIAMECRLSAAGEILSYEIFPALINVRERLTYDGVNQSLTQGEPSPLINPLVKLRQILQERRRARGAIDFETAEVKVKLDSEGHTLAIEKRRRDVAESIIEECMLLANEIVARHIWKRKWPGLYRIHEAPGEEKINRLNEVLNTFGLHLRRQSDGKILPQDIAAVLSQVKGRPMEELINQRALRAMEEARYSVDCLGHFGLAAQFYTHFTSPIRRYPDLMVHRILRESFRNAGLSAAGAEHFSHILPEIALKSSQRERKAVAAEREALDMKIAAYMSQFTGDEFTGRIASVTDFGLFVELANGARGLVPITSLTNDYYVFDAPHGRLLGEHRRDEYRLGDEATVILTQANLQAHTLDFILKDNNFYTPDKIAAKIRKAKGEATSGTPGRKKRPKKRRRHRKKHSESTSP